MNTPPISENQRGRRPALWLHHLCAGLMALGAIGHSAISGPPLRAALAATALPGATVDLVCVVWHFAGGCMALLGLLVIADGWQRRAGWLSLSVASFYVAFGIGAWAWSRQHFFAVFVVLGAGVIAARAWPAADAPRAQTGQRS